MFPLGGVTAISVPVYCQWINTLEVNRHNTPQLPRTVSQAPRTRAALHPGRKCQSVTAVHMLSDAHDWLRLAEAVTLCYVWASCAQHGARRNSLTCRLRRCCRRHILGVGAHPEGHRWPLDPGRDSLGGVRTAQRAPHTPGPPWVPGTLPTGSATPKIHAAGLLQKNSNQPQ